MLAQSQDSVPPAPGWISKIQSFLSYGPFKYTNIFNSSKFLSILSIFELISSSNDSSSNISNNSILLFISFFIFSTFSIISFNSVNSFIVSSALSLSFQKFGWLLIFFNSSTLCFLLSMSK